MSRHQYSLDFAVNLFFFCFLPVSHRILTSVMFVFWSLQRIWKQSMQCLLFRVQASRQMSEFSLGVPELLWRKLSSWWTRVLQYFLKISIGIGIGNTIMNIDSSFLLIPIIITFMKQNCRIHTILVLLELHRSLRQSTETSRFCDVCCFNVSINTV